MVSYIKVARIIIVALNIAISIIAAAEMVEKHRSFVVGRSWKRRTRSCYWIDWKEYMCFVLPD